MHQIEVSIPLADNKLLYGRLTDGGSNRFVVLVHGMCGHMHERLHYEGAAALSTVGVSVLRVNLYGYEPGARRFSECDFETHVEDLLAVFEWLRINHDPQYIIGVGHSFGATVLAAVPHVYDDLVFWDGAHGSRLNALTDSDYVAEFDQCRWNGRVDQMLSSSMMSQIRSLDSNADIAQVPNPVLFISSSLPDRREAAELYLRHAPAASRLVVVPDSDHDFTRDGNLDVVFAETIDWLQTK